MLVLNYNKVVNLRRGLTVGLQPHSAVSMLEKAAGKEEVAFRVADSSSTSRATIAPPMPIVI